MTRCKLGLIAEYHVRNENEISPLNTVVAAVDSS